MVECLNKLGIALPQNGWTVDNLLAIANQAANTSTSTPVYGFGSGDLIFRTLGLSWYDSQAQPPKATFTTTDLTNAFKWLQQLFQKNALYQPIYYKYSDHVGDGWLHQL